MLLADPARRRFTSCAVVPLALALGLGLLSAVSAGQGPLLGALALLMFAWFAVEGRHVRREGDLLVLRSVMGVQRVPAKGSQVGMRQGGGRSPHLDVVLVAGTGETLLLARHSFAVSRAPGAARRIAELLAIPVDEASVRAFVVQLEAARQARRIDWRWVAAIAAVAVVGTVVMDRITAATMASLEVRCPGGQVRIGTLTMADQAMGTHPPGEYTFEMHPAEGPAWSHTAEFRVGQTTVLDCRARPRPAAAARP